MQQQRISHSAHSVHQLYAHLVFVTHWRTCLITKERKQALESLFRDICKKKGAELITFGSDNGKKAEEKDPLADGKERGDDHVHLLVRYPPTISISKLVQHLKGGSSHELSVAERQRKLANDDRAGPFQWSASYFAKSVGHTSSAGTAKYVGLQGAKRKRRKTA
jgi:putative transposase